MRDGVGRERRQASVAIVIAVTEQMMLVLIRDSRDMFVSLYLGSSGGQKVDVHRVSPIVNAAEGAKVRRKVGVVTSMHGETMRRGHIGRARGGCRGGSWHAGLVRRRQHLCLGSKVWVGTILKAGEGGGGGDLMGFLIPTGIGIVMDARVSGQLVGAAEALAASRELTGMRLLSGVSTDMPGLMFETVKGSIAKGAFVGTRKVLPLVGIVWTGQGGGHHADGGGHVGVGLSLG